MRHGRNDNRHCQLPERNESESSCGRCPGPEKSPASRSAQFRGIIHAGSFQAQRARRGRMDDSHQQGFIRCCEGFGEK